ncbi:P-loop containing nucleoside triphosphate hydrolase protein [Acrodontium crateriforme]|uniref:P-loop containing nucleoside triphosphate hydrolase protein n=1 Tax=Acrodontium crateriforme TaxID=150365 RepID=A0AAQ3LWL3_9PEZI|nr:P-loop containing nucleoside triphosphate hydrolase protein [Acrodontium crateriforme]
MPSRPPSPCEPNSDDWAQILASPEPEIDQHCLPSFSDDLAALHDIQLDTKRSKTAAGIVVQHRSWKTADVFRSDITREPPTSPIPRTINMASSPPITPSPHKRKFDSLNLGQNQLARPAKAQRIYYGINIHRLLEDAQAEDSIPKAATELPTPPAEQRPSKKQSLLWTEKYRARKFTDLIGDERTHRSVMHWLKRWDPIVFPGSVRPKPSSKTNGPNDAFAEAPHRKILILAGPPGLGKTTLAHVCAKQAGFEVQEINASDERSSSVVKGRIRDMVGTENVKGVDTKTVDGKVRKAGKPVCVVVDEVDGVVSGTGGGGEGGFVKALIDLIMLDQKNSPLSSLQQAPSRKQKGERFRLLRPLILVCNDVYHPSLRPLRQSNLAEIVHMRKPQLQTVVNRMQAIFNKEGVPCEPDGVRRLCEATWGVSNRKEDRNGNGAGEGDMRGIMVVAEWVAGKLRAMNELTGDARLTRRWVETHVLNDLTHGGGAARGLGRGGPKDIVDRVFQEGAGFPKSSATATPIHQNGTTGVQGVAEGAKRVATDRLRQLLDTHGDTDRIMTDCFTAYPSHNFQDDTYLSKPDAAYEWLHFHDCLSSAVHSSNEWELAPYLSAPVLAFHHLFASPTRAQYSAPVTTEADPSEPDPYPFTGPQASWAAHEATKQHISLLQTLQGSLSLDLVRSFRSPANIATDLAPHLLRMLSPDVTPVIVGGARGEQGTATVRKASDQTLIQRSVSAMSATGVRFERTKVSPFDSANDNTQPWNSTQWIYRMEPPIDIIGSFASLTCADSAGGASKTRYAVRQVLDQEFRKEEKRRGEAARMARFSSGILPDEQGALMPAVATPAATAAGFMASLAPKKDFFGRIIVPAVPVLNDALAATGLRTSESKSEQGRVWVTFHEGYSNAVRKPVSLVELMKDW